MIVEPPTPLNQDVDLAKAVDDIGDDGIHLLGIKRIGGVGMVLAATGGCERLHRAVKQLPVIVHGGDRAALSRDDLGADAADAVGSPGDQRHLAVEAGE